MKLRILFTLLFHLCLFSQMLAQEDIEVLYKKARVLQEKKETLRDAIAIFKQLDSLCQQVTNRDTCFDVYQHWGYAHMGLNEFDNAIKVFQKGQQYCREQGERKRLGYYLNNEAEFLNFQSREKEALELFYQIIKIEEFPIRFTAFGMIGNNLIDKGQKDSSRYYLDKGLEIAKDFKDSGIETRDMAMSFILPLISNWERRFGSDTKAIELLLETLQHLTGPYDQIKISGTYRTISIVFSKLKNFEKAKEYLEKAIEVCEQNGFKSTRISYENNLADILVKLNEDPHHILGVYKKTYDLSQAGRNRANKIISALGLANTYRNLDSLVQSKRYLDEISLLLKDEHEKNLFSLYYRSLGQYFIKTGDYQQAIENLEKGKAIEEKTDFQNIYRTDRDLAFAYEKNGDYKKALEYQKIYSNKKDTIFQKDQVQFAFDLEAKYESELKDKKLLATQLEATQKTKQRNRLLFIAALLTLLTFGVVYIYRNKLSFQQKIASQDAKISHQKIKDLEQKNKLLALSSVIEGQEEERLRVAKDLHDGIGGLLTTVKNHFLAIQKEIDQIQSLNLYQKTGSLIDEACVEVRRISHNMVPHSLTLAGLKETLEDMAIYLNTSGIHCTVETQGDFSIMSEKQSVMIYRIIQELINNVTKHSEAKNLLIQILPVENQWHILLEDDGKGFNFEKIKHAAKSLGLKSIESRVKYLNGNVIFDSVLGTGTTVNIEIPMEGSD